MPTKFKSPYAVSFINACKKGTPCSTVVCNIAKKCNKPMSVIWNSLCKAGVCCRQKFNGTCVYWPNFPVKKNSTCAKTAQTNMWQCFVEWCMCNGCCTPKQFNKFCGSQKSFMSCCRPFFGKQFTGMSKPMTKRPSNKKMRKNTTMPAWTTSYKFPTYTKSRTQTNTRRYRRAA